MNFGLLRFPKRAHEPGLVFMGSVKFRNQVGAVLKFSPDYNEYLLELNNLVQSLGSASQSTVWRYTNIVGTQDASSVYSNAAFAWSPNASGNYGGISDTAHYGINADNDANYGGSTCLSIHLTANNTIYAQYLNHNFARDNNRSPDEPQGNHFGGVYRGSRRPDGIYVFASAGLIVSGRAALYAYTK